MALNTRKYQVKHASLIRDTRSMWQRLADTLEKPGPSANVFFMLAGAMFIFPWALAFADIIMIVGVFFLLWLRGRSLTLAFKMPMGGKFKDPNNEGPGRSGKAEGIMYMGNVKDTDEEVWFTNSDIRTHILYLGTTGSGKTVGLKGMATNALAWGSGFVFIDGKADTDLWSSLSALVRRFGRDDDLLVLNYMTGNSDSRAPSNTMNPFSSGSASYLTNMLVELMPPSEGDNAMWKERAVSLASALMPIMTWKRDNQDLPLSVRIIRENLSLNNVIKLSRDEAVPAHIREGVKGYLDTLPGSVAAAFDDNGQPKPPGPDTPQYDTTTANQQHGYLAMQFTRALQSLGDDYGYIFDTQAADVDMVDVVLNRRILIVLIPALEKSGDEIANLGKIVSATLKGMMGSALGSTVEGASEKIIENKPTHSLTPFVTIFDEVGYYTASGMAVMAAQARSLGFCLIFAGQDMPALKKRVREEANSITANCNIKIFGKLEDPTETKEFFEKTVGSVFVTEVSGFQMTGGSEFKNYFDTQQAGVQERSKASYDGLKAFKEGESVVCFGDAVFDVKMIYADCGMAKAMRVTRFMALPPPDEAMIKSAQEITKLRDLMVDKSWTALKADVALPTPPEIAALNEGFSDVETLATDMVDAGIAGLVKVHGLAKPDDLIITEADRKAPEPPPVVAAPAAPPPPPAADVKAPEAPPQEQAEPIAPPPAAPAQGPDWRAIMSKPLEETKPAAPAAPPPVVAKPKGYKLPNEIEAIIREAGMQTRKSIFTDKDEA
ncbi:MAG TPA: TraM recognition domain-containing protein [Alphaproteobacteria bacterium]|nr:TraM recognition domain-containing protein [Alphaproteobacteria bacterium]